jgi:two-component system chemotaxis response regulator CheB
MNNTPSPARIMIVDDSAVIRSVITRTLNNKPDILVVGSAGNGDIALQNIDKLDPDIIILDIEMPVMDGITALPLLLKKKPGVRVLLCSTLSGRGAEISIKALSLGAAECILKPGGDAIVTATDFQESLVRVIRSLSSGLKQRHSAVHPHPSVFTLRQGELRPAEKIVAIGSSTGGPRTLIDVMTGLINLPVPIVITQHMPKTFTAILAKHITESCRVPCEEGQNGMKILPGHAYVAPGGHHMVFDKDQNNDVVIRIDDGPLENFCRPSVNPMLRSLMPIYGQRILCAILTGMGNDGLQACNDLVKGGGQVIAQDEATSVVWGMPGAVAAAGLCSAVIPPPAITEWIARAVKGIHK